MRTVKKRRFLSVESRQHCGGFTIIEVLIVLAIAGMILLIVFAAIPALTRSGRNNQRRQDVQAVLAFISHYELNHSGNLPLNSDFAASNTRLSYYTVSNINIHPVLLSSLPVTESNAGNTETMDIYNYQKCLSTGNSDSSGAGYNDIVALFTAETGGGTSTQCQQL
jgi:prepilin-type N-terminal cleavage/methylation domain-containing protein